MLVQPVDVAGEGLGPTVKHSDTVPLYGCGQMVASNTYMHTSLACTVIDLHWPVQTAAV